MLFRRVLAGVGLLFTWSAFAVAQSDSPAANGQQAVPVFQATTALVYLDVTVVDKNGNPVAAGLTKDDFAVTEDKQPQRIFSFEAPDAHEAAGTGPEGENAAKAAVESKPPQTILVLDMLNTRFDDFGFVRDQTRKFLLEQQEEMQTPVQMLVLGNTELKVLVPATRKRQELLKALDHLPRMLPFKANYQINFVFDLFRQSYDALHQIAIQNRDVTGRKNVIWIGAGPPGIDGSRLPDPEVAVVQRYVRHTVNLLLAARISLFEINPGLQMPADPIETKKQAQSVATAKDQTITFVPFSRSGNKFSEFADETGGKVFNQNNVNAAIQQSMDLGSKYYTLTYQPQDDKADGRYRRIEVKLRNPNLRAVTKTGYYSREKDEIARPDNQTVVMLRDASLATVQFSGLNMSVTGVLRHPDTNTAEITLELHNSKLHWQAAPDGKSSTTVIVTAVSRSRREEILVSRVAKFYLLAASQDADKLADAKPKMKMTLPIPHDTRNVRLALATEGGESIGSIDVDRRTIDAAPEARAPQTQLHQ
jgi:VWFA-related protein